MVEAPEYLKFSWRYERIPNVGDFASEDEIFTPFVRINHLFFPKMHTIVANRTAHFLSHDEHAFAICGVATSTKNRTTYNAQLGRVFVDVLLTMLV
jgi:hypothetical protein